MTDVDSKTALVSRTAGGLGRRDSVTQDGAAAFADVVAIPSRNFGDYVTFDYRLATEAGVHLEIRGLLYAIELIVFHFGEVLFTLFDDHVASRAGTVPTASMLQVEAEIHSDIEQRFG